ncbi:hypothetical protein D9M70_608100 [compost metagenome]
MAGLFEIGNYHFVGVGVGVGLAEQTGSPETDKLVAARFSLELQFFVQRKLRLEGLFAILHRRHQSISLKIPCRKQLSP